MDNEPPAAPEAWAGRCYKCDKPAPRSATVCQSCGTRLPWADWDASTQDAPTQPGSPLSRIDDTRWFYIGAGVLALCAFFALVSAGMSPASSLMKVVFMVAVLRGVNRFYFN